MEGNSHSPQRFFSPAPLFLHGQFHFLPAHLFTSSCEAVVLVIAVAVAAVAVLVVVLVVVAVAVEVSFSGVIGGGSSSGSHIRTSIIKFSTSDNAFRVHGLVRSILVISSYTFV